jgi:hypothetical protein
MCSFFELERGQQSDSSVHVRFPLYQEVAVGQTVDSSVPAHLGCGGQSIWGDVVTVDDGERQWPAMDASRSGV